MNDYKEMIEYLRATANEMTAADVHAFGVDDDVVVESEDAGMLRNAADAIEQLVAECNRLQSVYDEIDKAHHDTFLMYCKMKHERDAAVADLKEGSFCMNCKHLVSTKEEKPCRHCSSLTGGGEDNWEWRGVQEVNDGT